MVSLLVESACNSINTERNLQLNSNIKKMMQVCVNDQIINLHKAINVRDNRFFEEKNTDLLHTVVNNVNSEEVLSSEGYIKTTIEDYDFSSYNECDNMNTEGYSRIEKEEYITELTLNFRGVEGAFSYFIDENYVVFYNKTNNGDKYHYHFNEMYRIKDFKIDKNMFVHLLYNFKDEDYYIKTSLYLPFAEINSSESFFDEEYFLEKIKVCKPVELIISRAFNKISFFDKNMDVATTSLVKKYYFENDGVIYFNHGPIYEKIKDSIINEFIQLNNLNMYSYLSMLGLNDFKTIENRKISSVDGIFNNLFKNRFNNTLNGGINYFNAKNINTNYDYNINVKDDYFAINGNFVPDDNLKGVYKFKIFNGKATLFLCNNKGEEMVKQIEFKAKRFYMCNLKFDYLRFDKLKEPYILEVSNKDPYPFNLVTNSSVVFDKIYNEKSVSKKMLSEAKLEGFTNHNTEAYFDGKKIVIKNAYNYSTKSYSFDNHFVNVEQNKKIKTVDFDDYKTTVPFIKSNNYIYPRTNGKLAYTTMSEFELVLINENGFITDYWIENQGNEVYLKLSENKVSITTKKNECDYFFTVPLISDMILNESKYTIIAIEDNNDYESEWDANNNSLITDRFMNTPLFSMWFIENTETADIFTVDKKRVENVIKEVYNGGLIVYFDSLDETLYYNTKDSNYNYFNPLRSYENITTSYGFDDNLEVSFEKERKIENFTLECDRNIPQEENINLIMYNNKSGETFKLTLSPLELSKPFTLGITVDSMMIERTEVLKGAKFNFKITKINSILRNGKLTYIKGHIDNPVFQAIIKPENMSFKTYKGIKVDTKYECMINGEMKESYKADLVIRQPFSFEIPVFKRNNFQYYYKNGSYCVTQEKDDYFLSNFRTPGLPVKVFGDLSNMRTHNSSFGINEIIDKDLLKKVKK